MLNEQEQAPASGSDVERPLPSAPSELRWGSDTIAEMLRSLDIEYIALSPGASFRGLHDSLINHLGNTRPEMLLALHEEHAVAMAHGYARVTGKPMAVALHANVGLMHATMAIFNAWCDRIPILMLGGVGPMDAVQRRPWVDWIHTSRDLGALIRGYTKWDDQPSSVQAAQEALIRAYQIAMTAPQGPVYVCLDATVQEQLVDAALPVPPVARMRVPAAAVPSDASLQQVIDALARAASPVILIGRVSRDAGDWDRRVQLAERLGAPVITDLKTGATFPTAHALHPYPPGLFVGDAGQLLRDADVIISLDWVDLGGTLKLACGGQWPHATVISCSVDQYSHNAWNMDYQTVPAVDVSILASPDALVLRLLDKLAVGNGRPPMAKPAAADAAAKPSDAPTAQPDTKRISVEALARATSNALAAHNPAYIRLPLGWPGEFCRFEHPLDYVGFDGGGGIGSGPGMAVGAALALKNSDRLPVAVLGDGDYLMGLTAIWSAVHYQIPVLVIVANNHSFFNDELHQERTARVRSRPVENRWIGMRMSDPPPNLALLAEGQGAVGLGPVTSVDMFNAALADGIARVKAGATVVIDVHVQPEYARAVSSALMRHVPNES